MSSSIARIIRLPRARAYRSSPIGALSASSVPLRAPASADGAGWSTAELVALVLDVTDDVDEDEANENEACATGAGMAAAPTDTALSASASACPAVAVTAAATAAVASLGSHNVNTLP